MVAWDAANFQAGRVALLDRCDELRQCVRRESQCSAVAVGGVADQDHAGIVRHLYAVAAVGTAVGRLSPVHTSAALLMIAALSEAR